MQYSSEQLATILLSRCENIGPQTYKTLITLFGSPSNALKQIPKLAANGGLKRPIKMATKQEIEAEIKATNAINAHIIPINSPIYPNALKAIQDPPITITVRGNISLLNSIGVAIVGSRSASINGCKFTYELAKTLSQHGYVIISGLAAGIDTYAHKGALLEGTIAVIAGGINHIYPSSNKELYHHIQKDGLIISENIFGAAPIATSFPKRNRIISALSKIVIIVEAKLQSGSLITAKYAKDHGKLLAVIPGAAYDPRFKGSNQLIKDGAYLVEDADDIIALLNQTKFDDKANIEFVYINSSTIPILEMDEANLEQYRNQVLESITTTEIEIEELAFHLNIELRYLILVLLELELAGIIARGGKSSVYRLIPNQKSNERSNKNT